MKLKINFKGKEITDSVLVIIILEEEQFSGKLGS